MLNFNTQHYEIYTCIKTLHNTLQICRIRCRHVTVQLRRCAGAEMHMQAREDIRRPPPLLSDYSLEAGSLTDLKLAIWGQANWPVHWEPLMLGLQGTQPCTFTWALGIQTQGLMFAQH